MTDPQNPVELFRESLRANAEEVRQWSQWMREALCTAHVFGTARPSRAPRHPITEQKSPVERLREILRANAEEVGQWPQWMREALSTARLFEDARSNDPRPEDRDRDRDR